MLLTRRAVLASALAASPELHWLTLAEASTLIRRRKASPLDLTQSALARIQQHGRALNAFITLTADQALRDAKELALPAAKYRGPLHGIPIALKDLYDTAGVRTTAGSAHFADRVPSHDAQVVARLKAAGAIILGKLNMDEFAFNFTSETSHFGPVHNPWKRGFIPGGSSGASAAAVSAGLCYAALGSDTGGSIRLPAALCGIVGFKPSYGALPAHGVLPLSWSLDHVGPMCRTVEDTLLMLSAMGMNLPASPPLPRLRIGVPRATYWENLHPEVQTITTKAVDTLSKLTAGAHDVNLAALAMDSQLAVLPSDYGSIIMAEAFAYHEERVRTAPAKFHQGTLANLRFGQVVKASHYARAIQSMLTAREQHKALLFQDADLLVMPAAPGPAFPLGSKADLIYLRNLAPWNFYGLPAISLPCGFTSQGLPVGLQIVGAAGADASVLSAAQALEHALGISGRHPSL